MTVNRTILYYPTIQIRNRNWIKRTILYWDVIGSIVPIDFDSPPYCSEDMAVLRDHGAYRAYHPEVEVCRARDLENEFEAIRQSNEFNIIRLRYTFERRDFKVYRTKFNEAFARYLLESRAVDEDGDWLLFTQREGMLYMSLLAKYIADDDRVAATVPGTDWVGYQKLALAIPSSGLKISALALRLDSVLPMPQNDVSLQKILAFKEKRRDELLEFRKSIVDFQQKLKHAESIGEIQSNLASFSEELELGISKFTRVANGEKLATFLGTVESVLSIKLPDIIPVMVGAQINPTVTASAVALNGVIKLSRYLIDRTNENRQKLASDTYSYLYYAKRAGII
jgi:hypothetical protein